MNLGDKFEEFCQRVEANNKAVCDSLGVEEYSAPGIAIQIVGGGLQGAFATLKTIHAVTFGVDTLSGRNK